QLAADLKTRCQDLLRVDTRLGQRVADRCADGNPLHVGDIIQTRRNTTDLDTTDHQRVLNRDTWRITGTTRDGRIKARSLTRRATVKLTADYLDEHVVLGYATTASGAQGRTTGTSHALVTPRTTSSGIYVALTRGKHSNTAHVICDAHDHDEFRTGTRTPTQAFADAVVRTGDGERSAYNTARTRQAAAPSRARDRADDRQHQALVAWWTTTRQQLPAPVQQQLDGHDHEILNVLARHRDDPARRRAVRLALRNNNWQHPKAANRFARIIHGTAPMSETTPDLVGDRASQQHHSLG
ncbi:MAG: hypothetical protein AB7Q27_16815, partial [Acidimicrobiia bacterium]